MRCTNCPPEKYGESTYSFRRRCLTSKWMAVDENTGNKERVFGEYPSHRIAKAVHLIRDPFDNVVSRYLQELQMPTKNRGSSVVEASQFDKSREGFRSYCAAVEEQHMVSERRVAFLEDGILESFKGIPCHEDLVRWIEWHNLAFSTAADLELDEYVLQYESFSMHFDATVTELLDFLELEQKAEPTRFEAEAGGSYDYYTPEEREKVKRAFEIMASPKTWRHIQHYFDDEHEDVAFSALE